MLQDKLIRLAEENIINISEPAIPIALIAYTAELNAVDLRDQSKITLCASMFLGDDRVIWFTLRKIKEENIAEFCMDVTVEIKNRGDMVQVDFGFIQDNLKRSIPKNNRRLFNLIKGFILRLDLPNKVYSSKDHNTLYYANVNKEFFKRDKAYLFIYGVNSQLQKCTGVTLGTH